MYIWHKTLISLRKLQFKILHLIGITKDKRSNLGEDRVDRMRYPVTFQMVENKFPIEHEPRKGFSGTNKSQDKFRK